MVQSWEFILLVAVLVGVGFRLIPRANIPAHLSGHQVFVKDELISKDVRNMLMDDIRQMQTFMSNVDAAKSTGVVPTYEHIGEAIPLSPDGTCPHNFLLPNGDRSRCILPDRVDVGKHYILTGGLDGMKEPFADLINRVSSFARYTFLKDLDKYPVIKNLFESEDFQSAAKSVCPAGKSYLDPFQFTFIINVPGQTVAAHLDAPYFWGANRFRFPQWLLVSMVFSGLFQDKFIDQIQVVGYLHEWPRENVSPNNGGDFVYYANSTYVGRVESKPGSGTIVDGSKVSADFLPSFICSSTVSDLAGCLVYVAKIHSSIFNVFFCFRNCMVGCSCSQGVQAASEGAVPGQGQGVAAGAPRRRQVGAACRRQRHPLVRYLRFAHFNGLPRTLLC